MLDNEIMAWFWRGCAYTRPTRPGSQEPSLSTRSTHGNAEKTDWIQGHIQDFRKGVHVYKVWGFTLLIVSI